MLETSEAVPCRWIRGGSLDLKPVSFSAKEGQYILRRMTAADYPHVRQMLRLVSRCLQQLDSADLDELLKQPTYIPFCCFTSVPSKGRGKGGEKEVELCGFCELYVMPHLGRAADGRLERVVVAPEYRGKGIATAMCQVVLRQAKEHLQLGRLDLTVEKPEARHIYTKLGFTPVQTETLRLQH